MYGDCGRVFYKMLYDTNGKQLPHQQHSVGGGSKRSGGLIKQLSGAASGSQNPQQQNRLRMLLKRSSEPLLIFQHNQHNQQYQSRVSACQCIYLLLFCAPPCLSGGGGPPERHHIPRWEIVKNNNSIVAPRGFPRIHTVRLGSCSECVRKTRSNRKYVLYFGPRLILELKYFWKILNKTKYIWVISHHGFVRYSTGSE